MTHVDTTTDARALLEAAITRSGLSARAFAERVMAARNPRTIQRWRSGEIPISDDVRDWLANYLVSAPVAIPAAQNPVVLAALRATGMTLDTARLEARAIDAAIDAERRVDDQRGD